jgi:hypothetical protein
MTNTMSGTGTERTERLWAALMARRGAFDADHAFLGPDVPPARLEHARAKFAALEPEERVLAFLDETVSGNGKGGLVLTDRALYSRQVAVHPKRVALDDVHAVDLGPGGAGKLYINGELFLAATIVQNRAGMQAVVTALREVVCVPAGVGIPGATSTPAAWHPDPTARHEMRYWDSTRWTEHVSDAGVQATDPV